VAARPNGLLTVSQVTAGKRTEINSGITSGSTGTAFSPDGKLLAAGFGDLTIRLWDVNTGKQVAVFKHPPDQIGHLAFSADGKMLATGFREYRTKKSESICLFGVATGAQLATLSGHTGPISCVAFSPDGTLLASASYDRTIKLWDIRGARVRGK
jgi:WD40 repeat protein